MSYFLSTPKDLNFCCTFSNLWFSYVLFFANLHINIKWKPKTYTLMYPSPFSLFRFRFYAWGSCSTSFFVFITLYVCCKKVKPGWMQDYYKCIFWPWIQYNLYNITRVLLPLTFTSFQEDKNKRFRVHVSGINKNVIVQAVGDILIFLCQNFSEKTLENPLSASFKL